MSMMCITNLLTTMQGTLHGPHSFGDNNHTYTTFTTLGYCAIECAAARLVFKHINCISLVKLSVVLPSIKNFY